MNKFISKSQAQIIAKTVIADAHIYAQNHVTEFIAFLKSKENNPPQSGLYREWDNDRKEVKHDT